MIVNASWLKKNLKNNKIKVIDASWYLPNLRRNAFKEYKESHIPKTVFFDIDKISSKKKNLPHMLPDARFFEKKVSKLGICNNDKLIVYCKEGILSSPRVWWTFIYFGHKNVYILNGGLKAWKKIGGELRTGFYKPKTSNYKCKKINKKFLINYKSLDKLVKQNNKNYLVIDARPEKRYLEKENEPRKNIGRGRINNSKNLPATQLESKGFFKNKSEIRNIFRSKSTKNKHFIFTCGSGVAACNLGIASHLIGSKNWSIYDGSWTEWFLKKNKL